MSLQLPCNSNTFYVTGEGSQFLDEQYTAAGATIVSREEVFASADILLKVRPPLEGQEAQQIKQGSTVISFLYPVQNKQIVDTVSCQVKG